MQSITIKIPEGYAVKLLVYVVVIVAVALIYPYYSNYLARVQAKTLITQAQAEIDAQKIRGECNGK